MAAFLALEEARRHCTAAHLECLAPKLVLTDVGDFSCIIKAKRLLQHKEAKPLRAVQKAWTGVRRRLKSDQTSKFALPHRLYTRRSSSTKSPVSVTLLSVQNTYEESLGIFSVLPVEILLQIIEECDIQTLSSFRLASQGAKAMVYDHPRYKSLMQVAPELLCVVRRTGMSSWYSLLDLEAMLFDPFCVDCGRHGSYLYLVRGYRSCGNCMANPDPSRNRFYSDHTMDPRIIRPDPGFLASTAAFSRTPCLVNLPGCYRTEYTLQRQRAVLYDPHSQYEGTRNDPDHPRQGWSHCGGSLPFQIDPSEQQKLAIYVNISTAPRTVLLRMSTVLLPFVENGQVTTVFACAACVHAQEQAVEMIPPGRLDPGKRWVEWYVASGFLDHFERCTGAKKIWEEWLASEDGNGEGVGMLKVSSFANFVEALEAKAKDEDGED